MILVKHDDGDVATDSKDVAAIANVLTLIVFEDVDLAEFVCGIALFARLPVHIERVVVNITRTRESVESARVDAFRVDVPVVTSDA